MSSFLSWFVSPWGLLLLSALDGSVVFYLPLANDVVVVYLASADRAHFWVYPLIATAGSVAGVFTTYMVGRWISEEGLERWLPTDRLTRIKKKVKRTGAFALAALALIPPPFPFTPFALTSGALEVNAWRFLLALGAMRLLRFTAEGVLARFYGHRLIGWMQSETFHLIIWGFVVLAVAGSAWSVYELIRKTRGIRGDRRAHRAA